MDRKKERYTIIVLLIGLLVLGVTHYYSSFFAMIYNPKNHLSFHIFLELVSISIAFAIAMQGWMIFTHTLSRYRLFIGALFFSIALIDILHVLSFNGMPFFLVENSVLRPTWFWIISRFMLSIGLFIILMQKDKPIGRQYRTIVFSLSFISILSIAFVVYIWGEQLPTLVVEGTGVTTFKKILEYILSFIFLCLMLVLYVQYRKNKQEATLMLISAVGFALFAELIFTFYQSVFDFDNFLGHVYKVMSYYYLMKGLYSATIEEPFQKLMKAQEKINHLAYYDELTKLPNRYFFNEQLTNFLHKDIKPNASIILINLNRFRTVNDSLGTETGDALLAATATRLRTYCESRQYILARLGGDEFAVLLTNYEDRRVVEMFSRGIQELLQQPIVAKGLKIHLDAALGIAIYSDEIENGQHWFQKATIALHEAKKNKQALMFYYKGADKKLYENIVLENDLRKAVYQGEFLLHYQPQVNLRTGEIMGVEALVRWQHPEKGMIPPVRFIPVAEESGLIVSLGKWVIEEACKQMKQWLNNGLNCQRISVNLSIRQFFQEDFIDTVKNALKQANLEPKYLELEITESMTMDVDRTISMLKKLKALGVRIAIDDFGTGYSSFSNLHLFPVDKLKIDKSFIRNLSIDGANEAIVGTIITLGHHLHLELMAEGVETEEQADFLFSKDCNGIQGYLISRPLPANEIEKLFQHKVLYETK